MGFALPKDYRPGYRYDDYCAWEGQWELIDGIPHAMSPQPSGKHQRISGRLYSQLESQLSECELCEASLPMDWKVSEHTVLQPDLFVACYPFIDKQFIDQPPVLVVEVLSPSTRTKDLTIKRAIYHDQQVKYYVIIDSETETCTVLKFSDEAYEEVIEAHEGTYRFDLNGCEVEVDFSKIWN